MSELDMAKSWLESAFSDGTSVTKQNGSVLVESPSGVKVEVKFHGGRGMFKVVRGQGEYDAWVGTRKQPVIDVVTEILQA